MFNNPLKPLKIKPIQQRVMRYRLNAAASTTEVISRGDVLNFLCAVTDSSTVAIPIAESVKIRRIKLVAFSEGDATDTGTLCLEWNGDRSPATCTSVALTTASPAVINQTPPKDSLAGFWSLAGSDEAEILFTTVALSADVFLDIHIDYVIANGTQVTKVLSGASAFTGIVAINMPNDDGTGYVAVDLEDDVFA